MAISRKKPSVSGKAGGDGRPGKARRSPAVAASSGSPAAEGFRFPAEWEPHEATWIAWPHNREDWPGKFAPIPWVYTEIVRLLTRSESVGILVNGAKAERDAADRLGRSGVDPGRVRFLRARTDRVWTRDSGPMFVVRDPAEGPREVALVDWTFNAWAKYDDHKQDDKVPRRIARSLGARRWIAEAEVDGRARPIVLEGGAIDANGRGTLLTTEECLLSDVQARNPALGRDGIERAFRDYLGIKHTVWLGRGIVGDDTHGHVDDLARFVNPTTVVIAREADPGDPNHEPLEENWERLKSAVDQDGRRLDVVALPMPRPVVFEGQRCRPVMRISLLPTVS